MGKYNQVREAKYARETHPSLSRAFNCSTPILLSTKQNYLPTNSPCKCYKPFHMRTSTRRKLAWPHPHTYRP